MSKRKQASNTPQKRRKGFSFSGLMFRLALVSAILGGIFVIYLDAQLRQKFDGKRWSVPARVYARPLELHAGKALTRDQLLRELKALGYRGAARARSNGQYAASASRVDIQTRGFRFWDGVEPERSLQVWFDGDRIRQLQSAASTVDLVRLEPLMIGGMYPTHREDRILIRLEQVPDSLVPALLATEDRRFFQHHGVSLRGIARALLANMRARRAVQGGSTLTQQLVKNFYLTSERSLTRKGIEAIMAVLLDFHYSKEEILQAYLNEIYLGQSGSRAIHGFGLASQFYFGQPISELDLPQVATLVGMIKGPSWYNPRRHPQRTLARRNLVLDLMLQAGSIDGVAHARAQAAPLGVTPKPSWSDAMFPGYMELVRRQLGRDYREQDLTSEGLRIFTTLDPQVQWAAEVALSQSLGSLERGYGVEPGLIEGAVVVSNTDSGEVEAVVGGRDAQYSGFNRALDATRPIGSLVKPAVYLTALQDPHRYTLASLVEDAPLQVESRPGEIWSPRNFDGESHGSLPLYRALARSLNQATARVGLEVGVANVIDTLHRLGVEQELQPYPSLLLGSVNLTPVEVSQMYQTLAGGGFSVPLRAIREVLTADGEPLRRYPLQISQRFDPETMHLLNYALQVVMAEGTGRSAYRWLSPDLRLAGKTGTTNEQRDSWFAGYTGNHLAVVWLGRDDNEGMPLTGGTGALQVWIDLMRRLDPVPVRPMVPEGIEYHWVNERSGLLSAERCEGARYLPFIAGSAPADKDPCIQVLEPVRNWFRRWFE